MSRAPETFNARHIAALDALRAGASLAEAARTAACSRRTLTRWLARGRGEPDGPYAAFAEAVDRCRKLDPPGSGVADRAEVLQLLSATGRAGSVSAQRELMAHHDRQRRGPT